MVISFAIFSFPALNEFVLFLWLEMIGKKKKKKRGERGEGETEKRKMFRKQFWDFLVSPLQ